MPFGPAPDLDDGDDSPVSATSSTRLECHVLSRARARSYADAIVKSVRESGEEKSSSPYMHISAGRGVRRHVRSRPWEARSSQGESVACFRRRGCWIDSQASIYSGFQMPCSAIWYLRVSGVRVPGVQQTIAEEGSTPNAEFAVSVSRPTSGSIVPS